MSGGATSAGRKVLERMAGSAAGLRRLDHAVGALMPYLRPRLGRLALAVCGSVGVTGMRLLEPWLLKFTVDHILLGHFLPPLLSDWLPSDPDLLLALALAAIVTVALLAGAFFRLQRLMTSAVAIEITTALRSDLYAHLHRLAPAQHDRHRLGEMLTRLTADVRAMREGLVTLPVRLFEGQLLMLGMAAIMLALDWQLALAALVFLPAWSLMSSGLSGRLGRALARQRVRDGAISDRAAESLGILPVIQGFAGHAREQDRFRTAERRSAESAMEAARLAGTLQIAAGSLIGVGSAVLVGLASWKVLRGQLSPGDLLIFVAYARLFFKPLRDLAALSVRLARAMVAGERILALLETEPAVSERPGARRAPRFRGEIAFEGVTVRARDGRTILDRADLRVPAGQHVVLTGPSGGGKSTLVDLLPRFLDPDAGVIRIDGNDISELTLRSLRRQIARVDQEPLLFSASVAENIVYGREGAEPDEAQRVAEAVGVAGLLRRLPEGLATAAGERGTALSGGQRQAVALARAMIRDAPIVILDEPTTGLDPAAADSVISALGQLVRGRTVITVTHDARLFRIGDRVLVLDHGRLLEGVSLNREVEAAN